MDKSLPFGGVLMVKSDTKNYPQYSLPQGFVLTGYKPGYEHLWAQLMLEMDHIDTLEEAEMIFQKEFLSRLELLPTRCLFVLDPDGEVVGTASLWFGEHFGEKFQRIHWVGVSTKHRGKGLAKALLSKLMHLYNELGYENFLYLTTQTWSYKAINLYLKFGFLPYKGPKPQNWRSENFEEENKKAWEIIDQKLRDPHRNM